MLAWQLVEKSNFLKKKIARGGNLKPFIMVCNSVHSSLHISFLISLFISTDPEIP